MRVPDGERGATVVIVATTLLLLIGVTALAVDAGLGYNERRGTTNAADNAALAAAWEDCNPTGIGPEAAAAVTAEANGYDDARSDVVVATEDLGDGQWRVTISKDNEGIFGPATPYAADELTVVSEATALCDPTEFLEGMAVYADAKGCPTTEMALQGSTIDIDGAIHSNGELKIAASTGSPVLSGPITYGETSSPTPPGNIDVEERDYPIDIEIAEYRPGGPRATGAYVAHNGPITNNWLVTNGYAVQVGPSMNQIRMVQSGIYYTSNSSTSAIDLRSVSADPGVTVTFVAEGRITLSGSNDGLVGHDSIIDGGSVGMLFFSDYPGVPDCNPSQDAVRFTANAALVDSSGVIFAPNGHVQMSNASFELNGSVIAFVVQSSGASLNITYQTDSSFVPDYRVELLR